MSDVLNLRGVGAAYGKAQVLWDVAFDLEAGATAAVLGRNGVGKTTLMRTIMGMHRLSEGEIFVNGEDVSNLRAHERSRRGVGIVPQGRHVFPHLTVEENLQVGLSALAGRGDKDGGKIPGYIYDLFPKLTEIAQRKAGFLSGGEQQQLALGRALAGRPRLLLLDEPTEGIQPSIVQQIEAALIRIRSELGVAIVIIEQNLDFAWAFADQYFVMQKGRIVRNGLTKDETAADVAHLIHV
ncbi:urea ABC transporter ATP-binding subunit UrtE [Phenylobacterium sp.]|jgi:urea transport system ATP-binding protein|uniref:urea ABC transporter ATP-binding subunit UrtE n=1 Tax=Phenylobacterium sp. TaxID=1871053 RepID=UPI002F3E551D